MSKKLVQTTKKTPPGERTITIVLDDPQLVELIKVEGFKRNFASASKAGAKIIELGLSAFLRLPKSKTRENI